MAKNKKCVAFIKTTGKQCLRDAKHESAGKPVCGLHKTWVGSRENVQAALKFREELKRQEAAEKKARMESEYVENAANADVQRSCSDCKHSLHVENGYSNYTIEGRNFFCSILKHPADGFDAWYGEDKRMLFASNCENFSEGTGMVLDVEHGGYDDLNDAAKAIVGNRYF